jgi:hypothetical protein
LYALDSHGHLTFAPEPVRLIFYLPAAPIYVAFGPYNLYDAYLSLWNGEHNAAQTTW